jgi:hypothetical protein
MAGRTFRPEPGEFPSHVATSARRCRVFSRQGESCGRIVIEHGSTPLRGRVAGIAGLRESRAGVIWVRRLLELWQMARGAGRAEPGVLAFHVAARARRGGVFAGEGELGIRIVIEDRAGPLRRGVARFARLREIRRNVIGAGRALEQREVASGASRGESGILPAHVAAGACCSCVFARQRELRGRVVVEGGARPLRSRVTRFASLRELRGGVVRACRFLEFQKVARRAGGARANELAAHVAARARRGCVFSGQRELRCRAVVELRARPLRCGVARFTSLRESGCRVVRVRRLLELRHVAIHASCWESGVLAAHVTTRAPRRRVFARQRERGSVVIEGRPSPLRRRVAVFAGLREACLFMPGSGGGVELRLMTVHARRRCPRELACLVAARALDGCVFAGQRESRQTVIELRARPLRYCVAGLALRGELRCAVIRVLRPFISRHVATGARRRGRRELPVDVARGAADRGVSTYQSKSCECRMVKRCRLPLRRGVARFASDREARLGVIRIRGAGERRLVATHAFHRLGFVLPGGVACRAGSRGMFPGQRETRSGMIEPRSCPLVHGVARFAGHGEARRLMVHCARLLKRRSVAGRASRAESDVDSRRSVGVT